MLVKIKYTISKLWSFLLYKNRSPDITRALWLTNKNDKKYNHIHIQFVYKRGTSREAVLRPRVHMLAAHISTTKTKTTTSTINQSSYRRNYSNIYNKLSIHWEEVIFSRNQPIPLYIISIPCYKIGNVSQKFISHELISCVFYYVLLYKRTRIARDSYNIWKTFSN